MAAAEPCAFRPFAAPGKDRPIDVLGPPPVLCSPSSVEKDEKASKPSPTSLTFLQHVLRQKDEEIVRLQTRLGEAETKIRELVGVQGQRLSLLSSFDLSVSAHGEALAGEVSVGRCSMGPPCPTCGCSCSSSVMSSPVPGFAPGFAVGSGVFS
eukprot:RCo012924